MVVNRCLPVTVGGTCHRTGGPDETEVDTVSATGTRSTLAWARSTDITAVELAQLANHPDSGVRVAVAAHCRTLPKTLTALHEDPIESVRVAVVRHPSVPYQTLVLMADDPSETVRAALAAAARTLPVVLGRLAGDQSALVRLEVARHPATARAVRQDLANDPVGSVRAAARTLLPVDGLVPDVTGTTG
jgi:hypothetical protein